MPVKLLFLNLESFRYPSYLAIAKSSNIPSRSFDIGLKIVKRVKRRRSVYEQVQCNGGSFFL